jgi:hypothetical protein
MFLRNTGTRLSHHLGRAIAQAVSRWLLTAAARVLAWVRSCGICGGQSGAGEGFLWVLWFPLPILIPPVAPQSPSSIIWGWYSRPVVAAVPSGVSHTPLRIIIPHHLASLPRRPRYGTLSPPWKAQISRCSVLIVLCMLLQDGRRKGGSQIAVKVEVGNWRRN